MFSDHSEMILGISDIALISMAQWVAHRPARLKVIGLILGQGTLLGCGFGPLTGCA